MTIAQTVVQQSTLTSNGYVLSTVPQRLGYLEPTDPTLPIARLRSKYCEAGYLWLRGILNRQDVLEFRRRYFAAFVQTGLLAPERDPVEGIYAGRPEEEQQGVIRQLQNEVVKWAAYEAFCIAKPILAFYETFFDGPIYLHKRKLIRFTRPGIPKSTPSHYDLTYLRGGTDQLCSSWIPIGDIPVEMGGLIYLEGSDRLGRQIEADFSHRNAELPPEERISAYNKNMEEGGWITRNLPALAEKAQSRWLIADYAAGDMVVHSPYMIHAATDNVSTERRMRLSTDIRYQLAKDKIDARWTNHWFSGDNL